MIDLIAVGEILIDFTPKGLSKEGNPIFERNAGGAPANVAVQAAKLKSKVGFIGKVGNDQFGRFLKHCLEQNDVDTSLVITDYSADTTLAFVELDETGNREFTFYRRNTADTRLLPEDIDFSIIDNCKLFHFGSLSFTASPAKETVLSMVKLAKQKNKIISYDPNWRPLLWKSELEGINAMKLGLEYCDILKISEDELMLLCPCDNLLEKGIDEMFLRYNISIILVTLGKDGCYVATKKNKVLLPTYEVEVVDTTGSGDSFFGAFLHRILKSQKKLDEISFEELIDIASFSNAAGAHCATKFGAIPAMPNEAQILKLMNK